MSDHQISWIPSRTTKKLKLFIEEEEQGRTLSGRQIDVLYSILYENKNIFFTGSAGKFFFS